MALTPHFRERVVLFFVCFIVLSGIRLYGQEINSINLELIPHKKVRTYVVENEINTLVNFHSIHASWKIDTDVSDFRMHEKTFFVSERIGDVWDCYTAASPADSWNGHFVRFAMLISKQSNSVTYGSNIDFSEIDTGQVYFLDLRLLQGIFNVPVAFEIITVDSLNKIIEFSYIDGNKSQGKQVVQFLDSGDGGTQIIHKSYFKSDSRMRDGFFYPYFHTRIIKEFHRNMRKLINEMLAITE